MVDRLKDKVALVVGVGSIGPGWGNGKATAVAFAREGARVFCADVNPGRRRRDRGHHQRRGRRAQRRIAPT